MKPDGKVNAMTFCTGFQVINSSGRARKYRRRCFDKRNQFLFRASECIGKLSVEVWRARSDPAFFDVAIMSLGNAALVGTINAPNADLTLTGGSDIYGAVVVKTFTGSSSGASLHYDEGLARVLHLRLLTYREL